MASSGSAMSRPLSVRMLTLMSHLRGVEKDGRPIEAIGVYGKAQDDSIPCARRGVKRIQPLLEPRPAPPLRCIRYAETPRGRPRSAHRAFLLTADGSWLIALVWARQSTSRCQHRPIVAFIRSSPRNHGQRAPRDADRTL